MTLQGIVPKGKLPVSPPCVIPCLKHVSLPYLKHVSLPCVEQVSISYRLSCSDQSAFEHSDLHIFPEGSYLEFIPPPQAINFQACSSPISDFLPVLQRCLGRGYFFAAQIPR